MTSHFQQHCPPLLQNLGVGMRGAKDGSQEGALPPNWHSENKLPPFPSPFPSPHSSHMGQLYLYNFLNTRVSKPHPSSKAGYQIPGEGSRVKSGYGHAWLHF